MKHSPEGFAGAEKWHRRDWIAAALLFFATAAVVVWQNLRLGVLWDLSYILENAHRISLGDMPYRDFPFPYAPGTFLIQALLIKLTGRVFYHHVIYCALVGGMATVAAWRIILNVLRDAVEFAWMISLILAVPLVVLGIYCIYPHPFYDPDSTFAILICILLIQHWDRGGRASLRGFFTGAALIVPLFVKQNTGLAFLSSACFAIVALLLIELWHRRPATGYAWAIGGLVSGLAVALLLIRLMFGVMNYWHWTVQFAAVRRLPTLKDMLAPYANWTVILWVTSFAAGAAILSAARNNVQKSGRILKMFSIALMTAPFVWSAIYLLVDQDSSERAERLLGLWPVLLIVSLVCALMALDIRANLRIALPLIVIGAVQGAFLSQQLWGSTYALWPLLMILIATMIAFLSRRLYKKCGREFLVASCIVAVALLISGGAYVRSHERLDYANISEGEIARSTLPQLAGLSMRGPWIPQFEELLRYADKEIPREDGLLMIPGEDLFYYTTGRHPRFPVLMFDHTVNPYSPEEILALSHERNIRWLVVKRDLQLEEQPVENRTHLLDLLLQDFKQVESLDNYDVYNRK